MKKILLFVLFFLPALVVLAQNRTIKGKVTNSEGKAVPFATVTVKGTSTAVSADENGNFTIQAAPNTVLVFSAASFKSVEVNAGNQTTVDATLSGLGELSEVVITTALGIKRTDKGLGYSVAKVDPSALIQKSEPDVLKSLQGKVAGVDIRSSQGTPGAATRIQIRGNNSFFGNNEPLIIVDGIPYSNDQVTTTSQVSNGGGYTSGIAHLDPNDIATMSVLKGSSAAALYGSRASNGVLVITTKSGTARKTRGTEISVKSSVSMEQIANYPDYQNEYGAGSQLAYSNANGSWGPAFSSLDSIPAWPTLQAAYPELFPSANIDYRPYPNNVKDLFRTGVVFENSVGITGGNEKSSVGLTVSNLDHKGYVYNSSYKRTNLGLGASTKLDIGLNVSGNFSYTNSTQKGGFFGENQVGGTASLFARSLFIARNWDMTLYQDKNGLPLQPNVTGYDHPRWSAQYNTITTGEERIVGGIHLDFNINKWIRVDYNVGSNVALLKRREITEIGSRAASGLGRLVLDDYRKQELESNFLVSFTPTIHNDFTVRAVLGNNINQRTITDAAQTGNQFITKGVYTLLNTSQQLFTNDFYSRQRIIGLFADATIGYKNFAFLNGTVRNDWSSTLPKENRSYLYPSVSGSFVFTDAFGMQANKILDYGKIRAGWAKVGRDATPYSLDDIYIINPNFLGIPSATLPNTANSFDLVPEFTKELEIGTQLSFLKRRIEVDFTWYDRKSTNLIAIVTTPASSGYLAKVTNFGAISNKGIEIDLVVRPFKTKDFSWDVHGIFTKNKNIVTELTSGVDRIQMAPIIAGINPYLEPGLPFGYLRGTKSARDADGNLLIDPVTGWVITLDEEQMIGDPNPDFKMGITNTLNYKGISLNILWDMTKGGDMYSVTVNSLLGRGVTKDTRDRQTSWIIPGVYGDPNNPGQPLLVAGKTVPNHTVITTNDLYFSAGGPSGSFGINSATEWQVYDATVYRLREVTLGYDIPKSLYKKLPIRGITVSISGRNLWHLAPNMPRYTNFDPEVNSFGSTPVQGIELSAAPTTRRYGLNLNVTF